MASTESIYYHLVLPARVPGSRPADSKELDKSLIQRLRRAVDFTAKKLPIHGAFQSLNDSLTECFKLYLGGLDKASLVDAFSCLGTQTLILHIEEQNAGLLIYEERSDADKGILFEVFEASPSSEAVLASQNALVCEYPGRSVRVSSSDFNNRYFQQNLGSFLEKANVEALSSLSARSHKSKKAVIEIRNTADCALISQVLVSLLEAIGSPAAVPPFQKRVRDDVNLDNAELPWRRAPMWLTLRVGVRRHLCTEFGIEIGLVYYKLLICVCLGQLLQLGPGSLHPHNVMTLAAKLGRRLAKLKVDQEQATEAAREVYDMVFTGLGGWFESVLRDARAATDNAWSACRSTVKRIVPKLPVRVNDSCFRLSLRNSEQHLESILSYRPKREIKPISLALPEIRNGGLKQLMDFADRYIKLSQTAQSVEKLGKYKFGSHRHTESSDKCWGESCKLAANIIHLVKEVGLAYQVNPIQMSTHILNCLEIWVAMDRCVTRLCDMLRDYHPFFTPESLDVLHLPNFEEMARLRSIQLYLRERMEAVKFPGTVFGPVSETSFSFRYLNEARSGEQEALKNIWEEIKGSSARARAKKTQEWANRSREYELEHQQMLNSGPCVCVTLENGQKDVAGCSRCFHRRKANRVKIEIHEEFLPKESYQAATVVFELRIPSYLAAYRNATWEIFRALGNPVSPMGAREPGGTLLQHAAFKRWIAPDATESIISLASEPKSFAATHFSEYRMQKSPQLSDILLPLGLDLEYYDTEAGAFIKDMQFPPSFVHSCGLSLPSGLEIIKSDFSNGLDDGSPSYAALANLTRCPKNMTANEFMAFQRLLTGKWCRWLTILMELGSSNINFSSEDAARLIGELAVQAGPMTTSNHTLRDAHSIFEELGFCARLLEQIDKRLQHINWRETHVMNLLITLSLRLFELAPNGNQRRSAERHIKFARQTTLAWVRALRVEVREAEQDGAAEKLAEYGRLSALLCRKTFAVYLRSRELRNRMTVGDISTFTEVSIGLQEQLVVDLETLSQGFKTMLVQDLNMAFGLSHLVKESIKACPQALSSSIEKVLSGLENSTSRRYSDPIFLPAPDDRWLLIVATLADKKVGIHYNFVEGHLLVEGKSFGKLPVEIRQCDNVRELFKGRQLFTYPSSMEGMSYQMSTRIYRHEVHFGFRNNDVVIRTISDSGVYELVPREVFFGANTFDLPTSLTTDCIAWLNISTKRIEFRKKTNPWKCNQNIWVLDLLARQASRKITSRLVDPHSSLFRKIEDAFKHFEHPENLTVCKAKGGKILVQLQRLNLTFRINARGLLECRELDAEIDPDQDAGTWYGLLSKIVLRGLKNPEQRSIITPLGLPRVWKRHDMHVIVEIQSTGDFAIFGIDSVLGRLTCPPEPRLLHTKALFHALTSFILPDPLTGRTGREEAQEILASGICQPWTPLPAQLKTQSPLLFILERLCPKRSWYPPEKRAIQQAEWDSNLGYMQHDGYDAIVRQILVKSNKLQRFSDENTVQSTSIPDTIPHLRNRGEISQRLYQRSFSTMISNPKASVVIDTVHKSRDQRDTLSGCLDAYQIVELVRRSPFKLSMTKDLASILQSWGIIGGFTTAPDKSSLSLSDLLEKNLAEQWGSIVNFCRNIDKNDEYTAAFQLAILSFNKSADINIIQSLAALSRVDDLRTLEPPRRECFAEFEFDILPSREYLQALITVDYPKAPIFPRMKPRQQDQARASHRERCDSEARNLVDHLLKQWPNRKLSVQGFKSSLFNLMNILERVQPHWNQFCDNAELSEYLTVVQGILNLHRGPQDNTTKQSQGARAACLMPLARGSRSHLTCRDLFLQASPPDSFLPNLHNSLSLVPRDQIQDLFGHALDRPQPPRAPEPREHKELDMILDRLSSDADATRMEYANDLRRSLTALRNNRSHLSTDMMPLSPNLLRANILKAEAASDDLEALVRLTLQEGHRLYGWLSLGGLWPCTNRVSILEHLRSSSACVMTRNTKSLVVHFCVSLTIQQQLRRMGKQLNKGDQRRVWEEIQNIGHLNWDPMDYPDCLLLEIENDIMIREEQFQVAKAIISPHSESNSVLQMNMGKGKTSCIVPMVTAVLANKRQLCRLIVPKALLLQTAQLMQSRMGGLLGREMRHIPFSRRTRTGPEMIQLYEELHREVFESGGILLALPEHILSFKLSGLQRLSDWKLMEARPMLEFQDWLSKSSRDVLDESDFTLAVKTQLIYPSGSQSSVDGHPHRWLVAQALLGFVETNIKDLHTSFPKSLEVVREGPAFPRLHLLQSNVEEALKTRLIDEICSGNSPVFQLSENATPAAVNKLRQALSAETCEANQITKAKRVFSDRTTGADKILLVRGLLGQGILLLCLKKRWNVQYGLHPERWPIAVPFEAKGVPSEQAEFGHPDVAILFTCLAFYYSGLSLDQFTEVLRHVFKSDNPGAEYDRWVQDARSMPAELQQWNLINTEDSAQIERLWPYLRISRTAINHYMNIFVFPVHARQFDVKIQASGWDLPLFPQALINHKEQVARTTGFSGTNDNKYLLPLTIRQDDLPSLLQTNAEVLCCLLEKRNRGYQVMLDQSGKRLSEAGLLHKLCNSKTRILIDAGAFVLEMENHDLVKKWLEIDTEAEAAIYFAKDNRAWVQYRATKKTVPLLATPFAENLSNCLVYLDEAHTRGTDLKLPANATGALTLALNQTKDNTAQAAMRLRQLASTQSVVFYAPPEVDRSIRDICQLPYLFRINSSHCVQWLLEMTCRANEQLRTLYLAQGGDFCRRTNAAFENPRLVDSVKHRNKFLKIIRQKESQTLKELYGVQTAKAESFAAMTSSSQVKEFMAILESKAGSKDGKTSMATASAFEEVEQEREVEFQVEEVREVQRPSHYKPLSFPGLHENIMKFILTGVLSGAGGYQQVFAALGDTSLGKKHKLQATNSRLFVSTEFMRSIDLPKKREPLDEFTRSTEWILWAPKTQTALVLIPEEAEILLGAGHAAPGRAVHLIPYAASITRSMVELGSLGYLVLPPLPILGSGIPDWVRIEIGILSGRLYFGFSEYQSMDEYFRNLDDGAVNNIVQHDGPGEDAAGARSANTRGFILEWLTLRRGGQDISHTPMGYVCQRRPLKEDHPFFQASKVALEMLNGLQSTRRSSEEDSGSEAGESDSDIDGWEDHDGDKEKVQDEEDD